VKGENDLSDNNNVTQDSGVQNQAADFESSEMKTLSVSDSAQYGLDITGDLSFSFWIKPESFSVDDGQILLSKWQHSCGNQYHVHLNNEQLSLILDDNCDNYSYVGRSWNHAMSTESWYHLVIIYQAFTGSAEAFVNGSYAWYCHRIS
jgi:hypothetical protein